jgi:hypothetical protein
LRARGSKRARHARTLKEALGTAAAAWIEASVVVYVDWTVSFNGNRGGLRLQVLSQKPAKPAAPADDMGGDAIPF